MATCGDDATVRIWALQRQSPQRAPTPRSMHAADLDPNNTLAAPLRGDMGPPTPMRAVRLREPDAAPATAPAALTLDLGGARAAVGAPEGGAGGGGLSSPVQRAPVTPRAPFAQLPTVRPCSASPILFHAMSWYVTMQITHAPNASRLGVTSKVNGTQRSP